MRGNKAVPQLKWTVVKRRSLSKARVSEQNWFFIAPFTDESSGCVSGIRTSIVVSVCICSIPSFLYTAFSVLHRTCQNDALNHPLFPVNESGQSLEWQCADLHKATSDTSITERETNERNKHLKGKRETYNRYINTLYNSSRMFGSSPSFRLTSIFFNRTYDLYTSRFPSTPTAKHS